MESDTLQPTQPDSRRGVAMLVVLSMVVFFTMLGYMGMEMAGRDTQVSGTYLDINSRDQAVKSALQLALARLQADPYRTATQLQRFVADSSLPVSSVHQFLKLDQSTCSLQVADPGYYNMGGSGDQTGVKVQVVSLDLGSATVGSNAGDGIRLVLRAVGRGRNGDAAATVTSYQINGMDVPASAITAPTLDNALYVNGGLPSTNLGNTVTGNAYIAGSVLLNGPASINVSGKLRVNGNFTSNAPVTVGDNAVIGGDLYTNASAPMTFQKNLVVKGGYQAMNATLTVNGSMEVDGVPSVSGSSWNSGANLTVGGQYWEKTTCHDIGAKVAVTGNAFFDRGARLMGSGVTNTFANLYLSRSGGSDTSKFSGGATTVTGEVGSWATSGIFYSQSGGTLTASRLLLKQPLDLGASLTISGATQLFSGISDIRNAAVFTTGTSTYVKRTGQRGDFSGGLVLNGDLTMAGSLDANFGTGSSPSRWSFNAAAPSKQWIYENGAAFSSGNDPRVQTATTTNASGWRNTGSLAVPSDLFNAPVPTDATALATNPYSSNDLDVSPTRSWNQVYQVDSTVLKPRWTDLTDAMATAAGASTSNWTAADLVKIYNKYKGANGWLICRIGPSSSMGNLNAPGGTFTGKAIWILDRNITVNGNWPGCTGSSDIQMVYVRGSASLTAFGSPSNFNGYIHYENPFTGQMLWGNGSSNVTLTGAMHLRGNPTNLTGNGGNTLKIVGSQSILDQIQNAAPGVLIGPTASMGTPVSSGSTKVIVTRQPQLLFRRLGHYR